MISFSSDSPFANRILTRFTHQEEGFELSLTQVYFLFTNYTNIHSYGIVSRFVSTGGYQESLKTILVREIFCNIWIDERIDFTAQVEDVSLRHTWSGIGAPLWHT